MDTPAERAQLLSWLKRLSSKRVQISVVPQLFFDQPNCQKKADQKFYSPSYTKNEAKQTCLQNAATRDQTGDF